MLHRPLQIFSLEVWYQCEHSKDQQALYKLLEWGVRRGTSSHSCWMQDSSGPGLLFQELWLYDAPDVFCMLKSLECRQTTSASGSFSWDAMSLWWTQYVVQHCLAEISKVFPEREKSKQGEKMQTPHRRTPARIWKRNLAAVRQEY